MPYGRDETDTIVGNPPAEQVKNVSTKYMCTQCGTLNDGDSTSGVCSLCRETQAQIRDHYTHFKRE